MDVTRIQLSAGANHTSASFVNPELQCPNERREDYDVTQAGACLKLVKLEIVVEPNIFLDFSSRLFVLVLQ